MTLVMCDSFDLYQSADFLLHWNLGAFAGGVNGGSVALVTGTSTPYNSGQALQESWINFNSGSGQYFKTDLRSNHTTLTAGFAFNPGPTIAPDNGAFFSFFDGVTQQMHLAYDSAGHLLIERGNGTVLATGTTVMRPNIWHYLEYQVVFGTGTSGSASVKIDGFAETSVSSTNTAPSGNARANVVAIGIVSSHVSVGNGSNTYDDFYLCNGLGSVNNTFLGPLRIVGLLPNGAGTNTNLTKVGAAATNWQSVNEFPENGDTTYVASRVATTYDTYTYADLPVDALNVYAVVSQALGRKDDTGVRTVTTRVRSGGTEADSGNAPALTPAYAVLTDVMELNPVTAAGWTVSDVNGMELGPKVAS